MLFSGPRFQHPFLNLDIEPVSAAPKQPPGRSRQPDCPKQFMDGGAGGAPTIDHNSGISGFHGEFGISVSANGALRQLGSPEVSFVGSISKSIACVSRLSSSRISGA